MFNSNRKSLSLIRNSNGFLNSFNTISDKAN